MGHIGCYVPNLRFAVSEPWRKSRLGDLVLIFDGTHQTPSYTKAGIKFASVENIKDPFLTSKFISERDFERDFRIKPRINDIFMTRITAGIIGETYVIDRDEPIAFYVSLALLRPKVEIDSLLLSYAIQTPPFKRELEKRIISVAFPRKINLSDIGQCPVGLPASILEQTKIASFLSAIDLRIEVQNKIIGELESLEKGLTHQIIWDMAWTKIPLSELLLERQEKTSTQNQFKILSSAATGLFAQEEYFNHQVASDNNIGYKIVRKGDIILSPQNLWLGNINYNDRFEVGMVSPSYKVYSIKNCYPPYLALFLKTKRMKYLYELCSEQGASIVRRNLNVEEFLQIAIPMPPGQIQKAIGEKLLSVKRKKENESKYRDLLLLQKKHLLDNMFI